MGQKQHTREPWTAQPSVVSSKWLVVAKTSGDRIPFVIAEVSGIQPDYGDTETNANLMAAAARMRAVLGEITEAYLSRDEPNAVSRLNRAMARALMAIAEADGRHLPKRPETISSSG